MVINSVERGHFVPSTMLSLRIARVFGVPIVTAMIVFDSQ